MENKSPLRANLGLIILSVGLIVAASILSNSISSISRAVGIQPPNYGTAEKLELAGPPVGNAIPISITNNGAELNHNSQLKVGSGERLRIQKADNSWETIEGDDIVATFYHIAGLLIVEYQKDGQALFQYYHHPITWKNED